VPVSALRYRAAKKGKAKGSAGPDSWSVVGYSAAEATDLLKVQGELCRQEEEGRAVYTQLPITGDAGEPDCLYITRAANTEEQEQFGDIFIFRTGCVVFWNVSELERLSVLNLLGPFQEGAYHREVVEEEAESIAFSTSSTGRNHLEKGVINVTGDRAALVRYAFSDAISTSVKLAIWELNLGTIIDSIEPIAEDLKSRRGVKIQQDEVLQKTGEILALRHLINLSSDLLDTPDFYWDREPLEDLYTKTLAHLAVSKRTRVVNEKLTHCLEIMEMIGGHNETQHGHKLERIIIYLIMIEVVFELLHFYERKFGILAILEPRPENPHRLAATAELLAEGAAPPPT